jgi:hypothetical protein
MKSLNYVFSIAFVISGCASSRKVSSIENTMDELYQSQQTYYNRNITDKTGYTSIINFAKSRRAKLFTAIGENIDTTNEFTVLEGYSPGWGTLQGLVWSKDFAYAYRQDFSEKVPVLKAVNIHNQIVNDTGIDARLINLVDNWNVAEINDQNSKFGNHGLDGFYFLAARVKRDKYNQLQIQTIHFREFIFQ